MDSSCISAYHSMTISLARALRTSGHITPTAAALEPLSTCHAGRLRRAVLMICVRLARPCKTLQAVHKPPGRLLPLLVLCARISSMLWQESWSGTGKRRDGDPKGWSTVLVTALGSVLGEPVPCGNSCPHIHPHPHPHSSSPSSATMKPENKTLKVIALGSVLGKLTPPKLRTPPKLPQNPLRTRLGPPQDPPQI
jgi:hypothetical protein